MLPRFEVPNGTARVLRNGEPVKIRGYSAGAYRIQIGLRKRLVLGEAPCARSDIVDSPSFLSTMKWFVQISTVC